jgi:L-iditol 2-dehydrogenase
MTKAPVLTAPEKFEFQSVPEPTPGPGEVLVEVQWCGICGSDIHAYHGTHPFMHPPLILGHEFSAVVRGTGEGVEGLSSGDRVTVEPILACGKCVNCDSGRYHLCLQRKVIGCQSTGAYARLMTVPAERVLPIPDAVSFEAGATVEPLAVGVRGIRRAHLEEGEGVLVFGAGTIGLLTAEVAQASGADTLAIADLSAFRLKVAEEMGIPETIQVPSQDLKERIRTIFGPGGPDLLVDCVGGEADAFDDALRLARPGTRILAVGIFAQPVTVPHLVNLVEHELAVIGTSIYQREDFEEAIELLAEKKVDPEPIITHRFPLDRVSEAFALTSQPDAEFVKILLEVSS